MINLTQIFSRIKSEFEKADLEVLLTYHESDEIRFNINSVKFSIYLNNEREYAIRKDFFYDGILVSKGYDIDNLIYDLMTYYLIHHG